MNDEIDSITASLLGIDLKMGLLIKQLDDMTNEIRKLREGGLKTYPQRY